MSASGEGRAYLRHGGVVEGDLDERGTARGLGEQGKDQPQEVGECDQHLLAVPEDAPQLCLAAAQLCPFYRAASNAARPQHQRARAVCSGMKQ